jgi:dipeptidyl aminopeptidase/acylaminoacyl peptidase
MKNWRKIGVASGLVVVAIFLLLAAGGKLSKLKSPSEEVKLAQAPPSLEATLGRELYKLTIPYLRERDYVSELGEMEKLRETADYEVYQTSYDSDGFLVNGLLTVPKGEKPASGWPAVVFVHGYQNPATYQTDGTSYAAYWAALARQGFVVFKIDLRGHGASEGRASGAYFSSDYVVDVLNARAALAAWTPVDSARINLWGHSMAGNVILRAVAARPEIPRVAIWGGAVYSYVDMIKYGIHDTSYAPSVNPAATMTAQRPSVRQMIANGHGAADEAAADNPFWQAMIPTNYLNEIKTQIALFHAVNDEVVSVNYGRDLAELAASSAASVELHEYATGGHNLTSPAFEQAMRETIEFLKSI